jgi:fermentation-respiration switch protein FrsA (DUF1100 family)
MVVRIVSGCIIAYVAYGCILFLFQRRIVFPRDLIGVPLKPDWSVAGLEQMWLHTSQGKVEAWFLPAATGREGASTPAVIFAHGNAELIDFWPLELMGFSSLGVGLLLVEYPGYGRSEGTPSQSSIKEAFLAGYDALVARNDVDPSRIVLFGRSLGGGAACALAAERPSAALILMSTFTSIRSFSRRFLMPDFLVRDPFDNLAVVRTYGGPVLVIHGRHDSLIPYKQGLALYRAAKHGELLTYDCEHNDCPGDWKRFWGDMALFLSDVGIIESAQVQK